VVVVDANVLLYAVNQDAPLHRPARTWMEASLVGSEPVGFAWVVLLAFIRIVTLPAASPNPLSVAEALEVVGDWLSAHAAASVAPTARHLGVLRGLLTASGAGGNLTNDAHLAAIAVEHGARIATFDRDFERFPGVRWFAPS